VADGAFRAILSHMGAKLSRVPLIIGNYHFLRANRRNTAAPKV
jgi:hypothetical protein